MKYRLEIYNNICISLDYGNEIKDLFLRGCDRSYEKGFQRFSLFEEETGEEIFTLKGKNS